MFMMLFICQWTASIVQVLSESKTREAQPLVWRSQVDNEHMNKKKSKKCQGPSGTVKGTVKEPALRASTSGSQSKNMLLIYFRIIQSYIYKVNL